MCIFLVQDIKWWTAVMCLDYWNVCICCLDSHSDGTHSLQRTHWWASDIRLNFPKSVLMKKKTHPHLDGLRTSNFQQIIFRVNYSLNAGRWGPLKHIRPYYFFSNNLIIISWQEENNTDKDLFVRAEINEFIHPFTKHFQTFKYWAASNEMDHSEETMTLKSNNSKAKSF